jgi:hypothetical protein
LHISVPINCRFKDNSFQQSAFQLATSPHTTEDFNQLSRWITKLKAHEVETQYLEIAKQHLALAEKRLELDRERFELNAARLALKHFLQLQKIYETEDMDNEDKVRAVRDHLFKTEVEPDAGSPAV